MMAVVTRKRAHVVTYYVTTEWRGKKYWERVGRDKREAQRLNTKRRKERADGTFRPRAPAERPTFAQYAERWLATRDCRWAKDEEAYLRRHILSREWLASMALEDVRRAHTDQLLRDLQATVSERTCKLLSPKTVSNIYCIGSTMCRSAMRDEVIARNPFDPERGKLQRKSRRGARAPYSLADIAKLLSSPDVHPTARVFAALAFLTGMREGEICGLRWRCFDMSPSPLASLTVDSQYDGQPLKSDKQSRGEHARTIPVHPALLMVLQWWGSDGFRLVHCRDWTPDDFIVPDANGNCYGRSAAYAMFQRALAKAGVVNLSLHSTRHTFITLCRRGGARPDVLEKVTHNAKGAVIDQYTHWDWAPLCEAVRCLSLEEAGAMVGVALLNGPSGTVTPPGFEPGISRYITGHGEDSSGNSDDGYPPLIRSGSALLPAKSAARHPPRLPDAVQDVVASCLSEALPLALAGDRRALLALERGARAIDGALEAQQ